MWRCLLASRQLYDEGSGLLIQKNSLKDKSVYSCATFSWQTHVGSHRSMRISTACALDDTEWRLSNLTYWTASCITALTAWLERWPLPLLQSTPGPFCWCLSGWPLSMVSLVGQVFFFRGIVSSSTACYGYGPCSFVVNDQITEGSVF